MLVLPVVLAVWEEALEWLFCFSAQQGPSRVAPPTPTRLEGEPVTPLILSEGTGSHPPSTQPQQHVPLQIDSSSSSSSVVTSPDPSLPSPTTSASPPNIGPSPSSPLVQSSAVAPLLRGPSKRHQREKRHSFTAVRTTQNPSPPRSPASPQRYAPPTSYCSEWHRHD